MFHTKFACFTVQPTWHHSFCRNLTFNTVQYIGRVLSQNSTIIISLLPYFKSCSSYILSFISHVNQFLLSLLFSKWMKPQWNCNVWAIVWPHMMPPMLRYIQNVSCFQNNLRCNVIKHCQWSSMKVEGRAVTFELVTFLSYKIIKFCHITVPTINDQDNNNLSRGQFCLYLQGLRKRNLSSFVKDNHQHLVC